MRMDARSGAGADWPRDRWRKRIRGFWWRFFSGRAAYRRVFGWCLGCPGLGLVVSRAKNKRCHMFLDSWVHDLGLQARLPLWLHSGDLSSPAGNRESSWVIPWGEGPRHRWPLSVEVTCPLCRAPIGSLKRCQRRRTDAAVLGTGRRRRRATRGDAGRAPTKRTGGGRRGRRLRKKTGVLEVA